MTRPRSRRAFTLLETIVVVVIFLILLGIFVPFLVAKREDARRARCAMNLMRLRDAFVAYGRANQRAYPRVVYDADRRANAYVAFTGPDAADPFAAGGGVEPNDVTASLFLLVRAGFVGTDVFVCPSSGDTPDVLADVRGRDLPPTARGNFRGPRNLSYGYASPFTAALLYRQDDARPGAMAVLADKGPGFKTRGAADVPPATAAELELSRANSPNHGGVGQHVLYADGTVQFQRTPYCGMTPGKDDNIYTALAPEPLPANTQPPPNAPGYWGPDIGPAWFGDSYLVPTATDEAPKK